MVVALKHLSLEPDSAAHLLMTLSPGRVHALESAEIWIHDPCLVTVFHNAPNLQDQADKTRGQERC
jgi:hypothetical protein